ELQQRAADRILRATSEQPLRAAIARRDDALAVGRDDRVLDRGDRLGTVETARRVVVGCHRRQQYGCCSTPEQSRTGDDGVVAAIDVANLGRVAVATAV